MILARPEKNFDFSGIGLGIFSTPFQSSRKMFFMLYSINWTNFIVWLPVLLKILGNMLIAIVCFPDCDVMNFEINIIFLSGPFFYMAKKWRQKFKYSENEKRFFIVFNRAFSCQKFKVQLLKIIKDSLTKILDYKSCKCSSK